MTSLWHWMIDHGTALYLLLGLDLTLKKLGIFFQNVILYSNVFCSKCNILVWNWSNTMNIFSALWLLMAWCFSTRPAVATVLITHPCVSSCLWVNQWLTRDWSNMHFKDFRSVIMVTMTRASMTTIAWLSITSNFICTRGWFNLFPNNRDKQIAVMLDWTYWDVAWEQACPMNTNKKYTRVCQV